MSGHTHDHIDWADRLVLLHAADTFDAPAHSAIAARLVAKLPANPTVIDLGCGAGGMSTHFAQALAAQSGGTIILVDATPELLREAERAVRAAANVAQANRADGSPQTHNGRAPESRAEPPGGNRAAVEDDARAADGTARTAEGITPTTDGIAQTVEVRAVVADLADGSLPDLLPAADLVWASRVVHHLPDQQAAISSLTAVARTGGVVALAEGGLSFSCLPWDLGLGRPGLEDRLQAAQAEWFVGMRAGIDGTVPMPYGWPLALERAGLADVSSFSALVDHPAPGPDGLADYVHHHLSRLATHGADHLSDEDRATLAALLDPDSAHYLGNRRDLFLLGARTVHHGRRP
ncbi:MULTISPECIES: class I SAM-dependent methyltransferase [Amycolatopsis]|uniref:Class I SAM-dependent methyltransferase n=1 Tax=Amycolatopsis dendrobii TaxID=2760662 RepID=A0A7W3W4B2_9PSEU|nr:MULTISPECIES: methyltransferase domain-containing protein [Amycolatopsis]MBB1158604.1 class I SAM-dependent methyltransferase [Amycolatopsis dendrobii]UKD54445.1 methyltransferase domain-containing protein [Amycolatopsis sp. FU40]